MRPDVEAFALGNGIAIEVPVTGIDSKLGSNVDSSVN